MLATAAIVLVAFGVFNMIGSHQTEQPATGYAVMQPGSPPSPDVDKALQSLDGYIEGSGRVAARYIGR